MSRPCVLATILIEFSRVTEAQIIAEGVETPEEFETLRSLGIKNVQGYAVHHPVPVERIAELTAQAVDEVTLTRLPKELTRARSVGPRS